MSDLRVKQMAELLVHHSCRVQPGDKIMIDLYGDEKELGLALIQEIYKAEAYPYIQLHDQGIQRAWLMGVSEEQLQLSTRIGLEQMQAMDGYIGIRGSDNISELSDVPDEKLQLYMKTFMHPVHVEERVKNTKWVILRYPNAAMAQLAGMSTEAFRDFYFQVCLVDYKQMRQAMEPLIKRMEEADQVRIVGPGTDLSFSILDVPVIPCAGEHNVPDGEVFTAPVRDSVQGIISYNAPTIYQGTVFENVQFEFKDGQIVQATSNQTERLNQILNTDEGARYIGEFSLGLNPAISHPMKDILFDEKINGSFHFTPGQAYEEADNGNRSAVHWDLVSIQRSDYGGGEIYFDGELIRKDGLFVVDDLLALNPGNL